MILIRCLTLWQAVSKIALVSCRALELETLKMMQENTAQSEKFVGIEVRNTEIIAVCLNKNGGVVDNFKFSIDAEQNISSQLISFINHAQQRFQGFAKLGIAVPGLLNRQTNQIVYSARMPNIAEIDLFNELEKSTNLKLFLKNDANAAAFAEHLFGAGKGSQNMFYVTLGEGIGGALIFENKIWHGVAGFAGEFGSIAIDSEGLKLEDVASSQNVIRRTKSWFHKDATSSLNAIGEENITINDIVREAINEDDFAQMMLERTGTYIGTALAGVINLLNIEKIVIGGDIMQAGEIVLEAIINRAKELSFTPSFETTEIVAGELGENASAIGVAFLSDSVN